MVTGARQEAAVVLVDLQVGLCQGPPDGDPPPLAAAVAERGVLRTAAAALAVARAHPAMTVVHIRLAFDETYANRTNRTARFDDHERARRFLRGGPATELCEEVRPAPGELVLDKGSVGPFASTPLDLLLRARGIRTLIIAGVATHLAIESAAREAADRGFEVVVLEDGCAAPSPELHEHAVTHDIPLFAEVLATRELGRRIGRGAE